MRSWITAGFEKAWSDRFGCPGTGGNADSYRGYRNVWRNPVKASEEQTKQIEYTTEQKEAIRIFKEDFSGKSGDLSSVRRDRKREDGSLHGDDPKRCTKRQAGDCPDPGDSIDLSDGHAVCAGIWKPGVHL